MDGSMRASAPPKRRSLTELGGGRREGRAPEEWVDCRLEQGDRNGDAQG